MFCLLTVLLTIKKTEWENFFFLGSLENLDDVAFSKYSKILAILDDWWVQNALVLNGFTYKCKNNNLKVF